MSMMQWSVMALRLNDRCVSCPGWNADKHAGCRSDLAATKDQLARAQERAAVMAGHLRTTAGLQRQVGALLAGQESLVVSSCFPMSPPLRTFQVGWT
jgi:hypothetical protein